MEAIDFTDRVEEFSSFQVQVIGVSKDTHESHCSFQNKHNLTLPLISDST
jgi:peroxiredoxin